MEDLHARIRFIYPYANIRSAVQNLSKGLFGSYLKKRRWSLDEQQKNIQKSQPGLYFNIRDQILSASQQMPIWDKKKEQLYPKKPGI